MNKDEQQENEDVVLDIPNPDYYERDTQLSHSEDELEDIINS